MCRKQLASQECCDARAVFRSEPAESRCLPRFDLRSIAADWRQRRWDFSPKKTAEFPGEPPMHRRSEDPSLRRKAFPTGNFEVIPCLFEQPQGLKNEATVVKHDRHRVIE